MCAHTSCLSIHPVVDASLPPHVSRWTNAAVHKVYARLFSPCFPFFGVDPEVGCWVM